MSIRHIVWVLLGAGHLLAVICGACHQQADHDGGPAAKLVRWYAVVTGADSNYGFYAPRVGFVHRARFVLRDENGRVWEDDFGRSDSPEARLRLTGIVDAAFMTGEAHDLPRWRKRLIASWAATMFRRNPEAVSITVIVEFYGVPGMDRYRAGDRPQWVEIYRARVKRTASDDRRESAK